MGIECWYFKRKTIDVTGIYDTKVLDSKGKEIFTEYDKVQVLENYDENNNL